MLLRFEPSPLTIAMIASAMPAAIRPYSMAVAPDSSAKNLIKVRCNVASSVASGGDVPDAKPDAPRNLRAGKLVLVNLRNRNFCPENYGGACKVGYDGSIAELSN